MVQYRKSYCQATVANDYRVGTKENLVHQLLDVLLSTIEWKQQESGVGIKRQSTAKSYDITTDHWKLLTFSNIYIPEMCETIFEKILGTGYMITIFSYKCHSYSLFILVNNPLISVRFTQQHFC